MLFRYEAITNAGQREIGTLEAPDLQKAVERLRARGRIIIRLAEDRNIRLVKPKLSFARNKVTPRDTAFFCRQLGAMYSAGIPILEALNAIKESANPHLKELLTRVSLGLEKGQTLSESFGREWPPLFRQSIAVAEESGTMETTLSRLAKHYDAQARLKGKITTAMTYPGIVLTVSVVAITFLVIFVLPQFLNLFHSLNLKPEDLPAATKMVMGLSDFVGTRWPILFGGIILFGVTLYLVAKTKTGAMVYDVILKNIPLIGRIREMGFALSFARNLEAMYTAGIPLLQAIEINAKLIGNRRWATVLSRIGQGLRDGLTITEQIEKEKLFPPVLKRLIAVGEGSGRLPEMLERGAVFFEEEIETVTDRLTSLIEPVMLVLLGGSTAFILMAVITPIFKAAGTLK